MKIIAGIYGGRPLRFPKSRSVRPMSQKDREALFNILGPIKGSTFLDAYAGSGAIGLEALSRGAATVDFVEKFSEAIKCIHQNVAELKVAEQSFVHPTTIERWLSTSHTKYDIITAGPPFDALDSKVISNLAGHVAPEGVLVVWHSSRITAPKLESMQCIRTRKYGDSSLSFYKHQ